MRSPTIAIAACMLLAVSPEALKASEDGHLAGTPRTVHKAFNSAARKLKTKQRMVLTECSGDDVRICNYTVTGKLGLMAWSQKQNRAKLDSIMLIYVKGSNALDMFIAMGILMTVYSPDTDKSERGVAITTLAEAIEKNAGERSTVLNGVSYSVSNLGRMGLWFTVKTE